MTKKVLLGFGFVLVALVLVLALWPDQGMASKEELLSSYRQALVAKDLAQLEKLSLTTSTEEQLESRLQEFGGLDEEQLSFEINQETISPKIYEVTLAAEEEGQVRTDLFYVQKEEEGWFLSFPHTKIDPTP
ncbi:hypothetical protein CBW65_02010 [Tumebacillus avium]|uniref:DUF4878 domain-containing protein n=1 Tax=Tumebacillus avium TaxID=1903704 RepID=A0A1Y0II48_9BACL|nr:hypothetical protein [Tumebacillus avium]ARU59970.1 hypothetical protein CBW65_02010 [Tumebacillus avium]